VRIGAKLGLAAALTAATFGLVTATRQAPTHNAADATYAASMLPHHELGVRMSALAVTKADNVLVRRIAFKMQNYQKAELVSLGRWARDWKAKPSEHVHGMLTADEEASLAKLDGTAFDTKFLTEMIRHHEGAIEMSNTELRDGRADGARNVAALVVKVQQEQIEEMHDILTMLMTAAPATSS
jgi:uncharacterized protein (DUF305 family)